MVFSLFRGFDTWKSSLMLSTVVAACEMAPLRGSNFFRGPPRDIFTILTVPGQAALNLMHLVRTSPDSLHSCLTPGSFGASHRYASGLNTTICWESTEIRQLSYDIVAAQAYISRYD